MIINFKTLWLQFPTQKADNGDHSCRETRDLRRTFAKKKMMLFYGGLDGENTFSCPRKHHRIILDVRCLEEYGTAPTFNFLPRANPRQLGVDCKYLKSNSSSAKWQIKTRCRTRQHFDTMIYLLSNDRRLKNLTHTT